ncbi:MAG: helix-turn-helix domain-containing protein [Chryseolinea sp.]
MESSPVTDLQHTGMMSTALKFINSTGKHIFLTGKAGTGKTTFLKSLPQKTHKQIAIVAPTGIAALNAGGTTIHSQFMLPFGMFIPDRNYAEPPAEGANWYTESVLARRHPLNSVRKQVLRTIDLLIIDEVSMLRADLLDAIDYRLRAVRRNFRDQFGGVQLLLIGDLYQLPPVLKREEESKLNRYYKSTWFFESKALQHDGFAFIELDKIFRQKDDAFIRVLNNLRVNSPTAEDIHLLNDHLHTEEQIQSMRDVITLTTHNYKADSLNTTALRNLPSPSHFFLAIIENDFPDSMFPVAGRLELKVGAQIMFTRNDNDDGVYYNGKLATVTSIEGERINVSLEISNKPYTLRRTTWENKKYRVNISTSELEEDIAGTFSQYPVKLAWAITVHKSQGLTFEKAIIDVGEAFADGQVYVALSRLRSIDGLILRTRVDPRIVSTDRQIVSFDLQYNKPDALAAEIKVQQKEFLKRIIYKAFSFDTLIKEIEHIGKDHDPKVSFEEVTMKPVLRQIGDALLGESSNTRKFCEQLKSLLESGMYDDFLLRVQKGVDYYKILLWTHIRILNQHIEDLKSETRVKGYLNDLGDLDQLVSKKLSDIDCVFRVAEGIIKDHEHFDFAALAAERARKRIEVLADVIKSVPPASGKKKGKRKSKKQQQQEPSTYDITIEMFKGGMTIEEIASERSYAKSTIEGHLVKAVEGGRIAIYDFLPKAAVEIISAALAEMPEGFTSGELMSKLGGVFTFAQLRAVMNDRGIKPDIKKAQPTVD